MNRVDVLMEVEDERDRQDAKWGEQNHGPERYFAILSEEFGEVAKEVVEWAMARNAAQKSIRLDNMRTELVQTAAVAVAMIECLDRNRSNWFLKEGS